MTPRIDRRSFLVLGLGAVAWACSRGGNEAEPDASEPGDDKITIIATAIQGMAIGDTRQGFAILQGQKLITPKGVKAQLIPPGGEAFDIGVQHVEVERGLGGDHEHSNTEVQDIYVMRHDFDRAGVWDMLVTFDGGRGRAVFSIVEDSPTPTVGKKAIASKSPTKGDPGDVDPICTRTPECSMHEVTIADAISSGKPSVLIFGTPAFCTTRTCGPVVDYVEAAQKKYGDKASFIHVEEWKNDKDAVNTADGFVPAFAEWKLETEPWIFFIGSDGVIKDRWLGAAGPKEISRAVKALVET